LLITTQNDNNSDEDNNEESDDEDRDPELEAAMYAKNCLELELANHKFRAEARLLRHEIKEDIEYDEFEGYQEDYQEDHEANFSRALMLAQRVEAWMDEVEEASPWGNGARKRSRADVKGDENEEKEEGPPSPPTKRAKFEFPCVVPSCDKGYKNKACLQRHVYNGHVRVSDPVARRACRLLWGETFKGGRLEEINRRYGGYQEDV
jgi:hypothetical protein